WFESSRPYHLVIAGSAQGQAAAVKRRALLAYGSRFRPSIQSENLDRVLRHSLQSKSWRPLQACESAGLLRRNADLFRARVAGRCGVQDPNIRDLQIVLDLDLRRKASTSLDRLA